MRIAGSGATRPRASVSSAEIDARCERPAGWTAAHFAIQQRGVAQADETTSQLAAAAAQAALDAAGWAAEDIDLLISACGVMEQPIPGTAALIQRRLGLGGSGIPAFDVNATCLSFLVALDLIAMGMRVGRWRRVLLVSADIASAALDFSDPEASVIFGDGAAAVALEAADGPSGLLAYRFETYGEEADLCRLEAGGTRLRPRDDLQGFLDLARFQMDGPGVFRAAARRFPKFLDALLTEANIEIADIDLVVPHQASAAALEHLRRVLRVSPDRMVNIFADHGNQIAASMPSALHAAIAEGRVTRGDRLLLVGTAAGLSLGAAILQY